MSNRECPTPDDHEHDLLTVYMAGHQHGQDADAGWRARALTAEKERRRVTARVRARILERDGESCGFCGTEHDLQIDHIFPVALGGKSDDDNLQVLCGPCNRAKGARHDG